MIIIYPPYTHLKSGGQKGPPGGGGPYWPSLYKGLVTNYGEGGLQNGKGGGHVKFYPYEKGGGGVLAMLKGGGGATSFGVVFTQ